MSIELLQRLSYIAYIGAAALFVLAVVLFFALRVPRLISDLSGRSAKRAIASLREHNEKTVDKKFQSSPVNLARGKLTDKITPSGRLIQSGSDTGTPRTEKFTTGRLPPQMAEAAPPRGRKKRSPETTVLPQAALQVTPETAILGADGAGGKHTLGDNFSVDVSMEFIASAEWIE